MKAWIQGNGLLDDLGIGRPIRGEMQQASRFESTQDQRDKVRINKATFMMTLFVPGIWKEDL